MTDFTTQLFDIYKEKVEKSRGGNGGTTNKEEETPLPQKKGSGVYFDSWKQADQFVRCFSFHITQVNFSAMNIDFI